MSQQPPNFAHSSPDALQAADAGTNVRDVASKLSKTDANYRPAGSSTTNCGTCANYQGSGICNAVEGVVSTNGVSDVWTPRKASGLVDLVAPPAPMAPTAQKP